MASLKHMNNEMAVSPVVATLVLIVVAVIGAVAVGTIMGTFSTSVSKQANAQGAASASDTNILVAGSTTVYPASVILASDYMNQHQGIKITVQGGGSGAGVTAAGEGIADIGSTSSAVTTAQMTAYPNLKTFQIGARSVVWIVNANSKATVANQTDIQNLIIGNSIGTGDMTGINKLIQRSDASGTESTAAKWVGNSTYYSGDSAFDNIPGPTASYSGNAGVLAEINGNTAGNELGFVDLGYVYSSTGAVLSGATNVIVLPVKNVAGNTYTFTTGANLRANCLQSVKDMMAGTPQSTSYTSNYPQTLDSGLWYVTNGNPSSVVQDFINFAQSPNGATDLQSAGDFSLLEISP
jgi:phosphate transport system substrate-binding protein